MLEKYIEYIEWEQTQLVNKKGRNAGAGSDAQAKLATNFRRVLQIADDEERSGV